MKKLLLTLALAGGAVFSSLAQSTTTTPSSPASSGAKFSIGAEAGLPIGDVSNAYSAVLGGSVKFELPTVSHAFFTISAGYNAFLLKSELKGIGIPSTSGFIPVKAGAKYYTEGNLFLEGQLGIVFSTESGGGHAFAWSPGIGYSFNGGFELGARYEGWTNGSTISQVGLRVAYRF
jgi:hypothetical protein